MRLHTFTDLVLAGESDEDRLLRARLGFDGCRPDLRGRSFASPRQGCAALNSLAGLNEEYLTPAKAPQPKFRSEKAAADYFQTHSIGDVWNQLHEARQATLAKAVEKSIRQRAAATKSPGPATFRP
jgi:hypothetical protein